MQRVGWSRAPSHPRRHMRRAAAVMTGRCLTALVGGYGLSAALSTLVARLLPLTRVEATVWAMIPAFLLYAGVALWCFHEPRLSRVVGGVWGGAIAAVLMVWWLGVRP